MNDQQLMIHIGYQKTASTWLQKVIFNNQNLVFFTPWGSPTPEAIEQFIICNSFSFSADSARKVFESGLKEAAKLSLVPVISHESLAGNIIKGRYYGKETADRIKLTFPDAKILLFIREQKKIVFSAYKEYIKTGGTAKIEKYCGTGKHKSGFAPICSLSYLKYDLLISYYQNLFGKNNVMVLPFEFFKKDQQGTCNMILKFVGLKEKKIEYAKAKNVGFKGATLDIRRKINRYVEFRDEKDNITKSWQFTQKISVLYDQLVPNKIHKLADKKYKQFIAESIGDYFRESNKKTSNLIGIDLKNIGYDC